jgi:hypothetical protein
MIELGFCVFERLGYGGDVWYTPVGVLAYVTILPFEPVAGGQLFNPIDQGPRRWNIVHGQVAVQPLETKPAFDFGMDENALQLRSKEDVLAALGDVKRLDADAVASQHQTLPGVGPKGDRKHASQPLETGGVPFKKCLKNGLGIAVGLKAAAECFELAAYFKVIVDFAVEDDYGVAILGKYGLIAGCQVDNLEAGRTERAGSRLQYTLLIWAAMNEGIRRRLDSVLVRVPVFRREPNNAAQMSMPLPHMPLWKPRHAEYWTRRKTVCADNSSPSSCYHHILRGESRYVSAYDYFWDGEAETWMESFG